MKSKRIKILLISFAVLAAIGFLEGIVTLTTDFYVKNSVKDRVYTVDDLVLPEEKYDCIFVLGCGIRADGTPSHMLQDRLETAYALYLAGASDYILVSGDNGKVEYNEVEVMKNYLVEKGVPEEAIYMDHAGFSTYESMYRAKAIFSITRMVVVTQEYHLYRSLYVAENFGIEADGVGADVRRYYGQTMRDLREIVARAKDFAFVILKPSATYVGDPIPMDGSGDATNENPFW
jgi:vancomycin permeability regulator SanA